jgi:hypothetical protein
MIAKAIKGKGFRGALEYDLKKEQGRIIDTNMDGRGPRELAAEFGEIRKLRPNLGKAVLHVSLAASPGEHLTDAQWVKIGQYYINGMGLNQNQYVMSRHTDTEHEHIHMVVNRIQFDGKVTSDSHDYRRQEFLMRALERDLGLRQIESSTKTERRAATKGEIEEGLRTGKPSTRQRLQQLCDAAAKDCDTFTRYAERLEAAGVKLVPVLQLDGTKMSGLSYRLDGVMMKGSDLGKRYSPAGLAKHGVSYVKERDYEAVGRCIERSALDRVGAGDRNLADGETSQRGPVGIDAGTPGAGDGGADGRNTRDDGGDLAARPGAGRPAEDADRNRIERLEPCVVRSAAGSAEPGCSGPTNGAAPVRVSGNDRVDHGAARERILALAGATHSAEPPGRQGGGGNAAPRDRTREAVQRQITALGADRYEVVIIHAKMGQQTKREWNAAELMAGVQWLKRLNARGGDILVRPLGGPELRLIASLDADGVDKLRSNGLAPAATVQTRPGRFEAWVKLSDQPLPPSLRDALLARLTRGFGEAGLYGRLAGFTNQQADVDNAGWYPFSLLHNASGKVALVAAQQLAELRRNTPDAVSKQQRLLGAANARPGGRGRSR